MNLASNSLKIDCYPDADFAGMYGHESNTDPACVKSRTGYVINVTDCPVLWVYRLQRMTACSTTEAETIDLTQSCRELFPIMDIAKSVSTAVGLLDPTTAIKVSIHEDTTGALILVQTLPPQFVLCSKHYVIMANFFCEEMVKRGITLLKIDTIEQLGNIFTKSLPKVMFEYL